uniref:Secreted protein n=1 Tax=Anopheles funestus TaxID=62324 RepID=A0A182S2L8_ANOFN
MTFPPRPGLAFVLVVFCRQRATSCCTKRVPFTCCLAPRAGHVRNGCVLCVTRVCFVGSWNLETLPTLLLPVAYKLRASRKAYFGPLLSTSDFPLQTKPWHSEQQRRQKVLVKESNIPFLLFLCFGW